MRFARGQWRHYAVPVHHLGGAGSSVRSAEYGAEGRLRAVSTAPARPVAPRKHELTLPVRRANRPADAQFQLNNPEAPATCALTAAEAPAFLFIGASPEAAPTSLRFQDGTVDVSGRPQPGPVVPLGHSPARRGPTRRHTSPGFAYLPRRWPPWSDSPPPTGCSPGAGDVRRCMRGLPLIFPRAAGVPERSIQTACAENDMCLSDPRTSIHPRSFANPGTRTTGYTERDPDSYPRSRMYGKCRLYRADCSRRNSNHVVTQKERGGSR